MSQNQVNLASFLLKEHFGEIVQTVGTYLMKNGPSPLPLIFRAIDETNAQVKKSLCVLLQHNLITFATNDRGFATYEIEVDRVLRLLRYPRFVGFCKDAYGPLADLIVKEVLVEGRMTMTKIIHRVLEVTDDSVTPLAVKDKFSELVDAFLLQRCPEIIGMKVKEPSEDAYDIPKVPVAYLMGKRKRSLLSEAEDVPAAKKQKIDDTYPDDGIFWRLNYNRFHQLFRDESILSAVNRRIGASAERVMKTILRLANLKNEPWVPVTNPMGKQDITAAAMKDFHTTPEELSQHLAILTDDATEFLQKHSEAHGGTYVAHMKNAVSGLAWFAVESIVTERFGSKCGRVFRLLRLKKYLEQKQIEEMAMIPPKDAKEMTYRMYQENFIQCQEIPRTPDYAPSRTFFLFHVDLNQVARMVLQICYKAVFNAKCRVEHELKENKRTLERKERIEAIVASLRAQGADQSQIHEMEELISPPERAQIERVEHSCTKLQSSELQLDETIFILETYLKYTLEKH